MCMHSGAIESINRDMWESSLAIKMHGQHLVYNIAEHGMLFTSWKN